VPPLHPNLRRQLEAAVIKARDIAEAGARVALQALAVEQRETFGHMKPDQRQLRVQLRARAKQLGDEKDDKGRFVSIDHLVVECAYEQWHRMLFARFLAENSLLMHPDGVAVTLKECKEIAESEGADDEWELAGRYAARMLPQIFRPDDPVLQVQFAPEHKVGLEKLLAGLPSEVFTADDGMGWVYQFWQSKRKDEVNASGRKIGADELPAVTQLFTEHYMVLFLLHNTIGAWWAGKYLAEHPDVAADDSLTENDLRRRVALDGCEFEYLRFVRTTEKGGGAEAWRPAAGTFPGWPVNAAELKILDPCCGSGHFLVAAFELMVRLRMSEEGLPAREACDAVLRDNIHGLEIDERCCQIAAFALAMAAWRFPGAGGYRILPELHIACTGIGPQATEEQWLKLAEQSRNGLPTRGREEIRNGLLNIHRLFSQAPTLGSLINPLELPGDLIAADYETIQPYLAAALSAETTDDEVHERTVAAAGMVKAAELLAGDYTLVITNVPYLARGKQSDPLRDFIQIHYEDARQDLATAFLGRCLDFAQTGGTLGIVCPQNWLTLPAYSLMRKRLLRTRRFEVLAKLGPGAFGTISGAVVNVALVAVTAGAPPEGSLYGGVDTSATGGVQQKAEELSQGDWRTVSQKVALVGPDARITLEALTSVGTLGEFAISPQGIKTGDDGRFRRNWWELQTFDGRWRPFQGTPEANRRVGGMRYAIDWEDEGQSFARLQGRAAWGKPGVIVKLMGDFAFSLYSGEFFDSNVTAIVPADEMLLQPIWHFCLSPNFRHELSALEDGIKVNNATVTKAPFDLTHWQHAAASMHSHDLFELESDDPTQWLFYGRPNDCTAPLQVAVARLLGYRWPAELDDKMRLSSYAREMVKRCDELLGFADKDGIVCIPSSRGERPAADRLRDLLVAAYGDYWSPAREAELLEQAGSGGKSLDDWLRDGFFEQHCKLFHHRPFIWHIWDGRRRDGFHALVNYHKLDRRLLETLTYAHVGDWIKLQKEDVDRGRSGAEARLIAAQELQKKLVLILAGEKPHDIFVRWKPIEQQPIGWEPDLNDGVRLNIRPFMTAGVLRKDPNINWKKDRGTDPKSAPWYHVFKGERINDFHLTLAEKQRAREAVQNKE